MHACVSEFPVCWHRCCVAICFDVLRLICVGGLTSTHCLRNGPLADVFLELYYDRRLFVYTYGLHPYMTVLAHWRKTSSYLLVYGFTHSVL